MTNLIWFLVTIGGLWFVFKWLEKKKKAKDPEADTGKKNDPQYVQDLFNYKKIESNGLVCLEGGTYALVLDVMPIKVNMKNQSEKDSVWFNFRSFANSLPTHITLLLQSQYLDMTDYIEDYVAGAQERDQNTLTPELQKSAMDVGDFIGKQYSERKTRDYKAYVIIRYNPYRQGTEAGVSTGNASFDSIIKQMRGEATNLPKDEAEELAQNMMDEVASLVYSSFDSFRCRVTRLDKEGVINMLHQTMNRDLASYESLGNLYDSGAFATSKQSLTPHMSVAATVEKEEVS